MIEKAAALQKCSVIAVVKADAYGHGAALTAQHLVERCGCSCFAVATLEEAVKLRKVFVLDHSGSPLQSKQPFVRIMVLGPPINYPRCFDTYFHYGIEVMVSSPEVANALLRWSLDDDGRRLRQVESAALERKEEVLLQMPANSGGVALRSAMLQPNKEEEEVEKVDGVDVDYVSSLNLPVVGSSLSAQKNTCILQRMSSVEPDIAAGDIITTTRVEKEHISDENCNHLLETTAISKPIPKIGYSATLSQTSGEHLALEVKSILLNQAELKKNQMKTICETSANSSRVPSRIQSRSNSPGVDGNHVKVKSETSSNSLKNHGHSPTEEIIGSNRRPQTLSGVSRFKGIEDVARNSRNRAVCYQQKNEQNEGIGPVGKSETTFKSQVRRKLRWHALIDSGMGRLGFKTDDSPTTLSIIKHLVDADVIQNAPVEFFGMCTHMAEAVEGSKYTQSQMQKFVDILNEVRKAGITVQTLSSDNSSALLTKSLSHFNPSILDQPTVDTRGFVRCGGGIYGQRSFTQLRAVSSLSARVRHVSIMNPGDTVGYDRAYVAYSRTRIATLSIGFADGYPRDLGNNVGRVSIRGMIFPIAGNVCMDMLMVDLGEVEDGNDHYNGSLVQVGDEAILWGPDESSSNNGLIQLSDLASTLKTTQSALTCGLNIERVERKLVE